MPRTLRARAALALLLLLGAAPARAGLAVRYFKAGEKFTVTAHGNKLRVEREGDPRVVLFDGDAMQLIQLDGESKTWSMVTRDQARAAGKAYQAKLAEQDAALPPEEARRVRAERRAEAQRRLELPKTTVFEPTGEQAMIADQMCDGYREKVGGKVVAEGCYITWSKKTVTRDEVKALTRLAEFLGVAAAEIEALHELDLRDGALGRLARAPGLPAVRADLIDGGKVAVPLKLLELRRDIGIPPETFKPPAGFTRVDRPDWLERAMRR